MSQHEQKQEKPTGIVTPKGEDLEGNVKFSKFGIPPKDTNCYFQNYDRFYEEKYSTFWEPQTGKCTTLNGLVDEIRMDDETVRNQWCTNLLWLLRYGAISNRIEDLRQRGKRKILVSKFNGIEGAQAILNYYDFGLYEWLMMNTNLFYNCPPRECLLQLKREYKPPSPGHID